MVISHGKAQFDFPVRLLSLVDLPVSKKLSLPCICVYFYQMVMYCLHKQNYYSKYLCLLYCLYTFHSFVDK